METHEIILVLIVLIIVFYQAAQILPWIIGFFIISLATVKDINKTINYTLYFSIIAIVIRKLYHLYSWIKENREDENINEEILYYNNGIINDDNNKEQYVDVKHTSIKAKSHDEQYDEIKELLNKIMLNDYESFVKAIISLNTNIEDQEKLKRMYEEFIKDKDMMLINDKFVDIDVEVSSTLNKVN